MDDLCPRFHMKFILFEISCSSKSWNIGIKRNEHNKQICQSQVKTPMFGEKVFLETVIWLAVQQLVRMY